MKEYSENPGARGKNYFQKKSVKFEGFLSPFVLNVKTNHLFLF